MRLGAGEVRAVLPHREPFIFIDEVLHVEPGQRIDASWAVNPAHPVLEGHFPGLPILPGVLAVEAIAQAGGLCCLLAEGNEEGKVGVLAAASEICWHHPIRPGDELVVQARILRLNRKCGKVQGRVWAIRGDDARIVCEVGEVTLIMVPREQVGL